jgi:hypothetical protein
VTLTHWATIGAAIFGLIAGVVASWITRPAKLGTRAFITLFCVVIVGYLVFTVIANLPNAEQQRITSITCPRLFDKAHRLLESSPLAAPPLAGFAFTPSQDLPGRVDLTLAWINPQPITKSSVAIEGVYGQVGPNDEFIDHRQPAATTGECWNWYHYETRDDAQPETVRLQVNGLWPEQQYCFYTAFRTDKGYSKPTTIRCETATWKSTWGEPAQAPKN